MNNRRWFLKTASLALASSASTGFRPFANISEASAKEKALPHTQVTNDRIGVHLPLWHQGSLDGDKFWNEIFKDLNAHKIQHCFILNYYFVDPVMGKISKKSHYNNNQAPDLAFIKHGLEIAQKWKIKASLYPVLEIDNPYQIGSIWRGNLNFFGRTLETFFHQYIKLINEISEVSRKHQSPYICIGSELASLSHNIAARPFWEELIYQLRSPDQDRHLDLSPKLIYAAHWEEYLSFPFWRHLDDIGINAYFPLSSRSEASPIGAPSHQQIQKNLSKKLKELHQFSKVHGRPVHLTEFGLTPYNQTLATPWGSPQNQSIDLIEQENGYRALLGELKKENTNWLKGVSFWHWKLPYRLGSDYNIRPYGTLAKLLKNNS